MLINYGPLFIIIVKARGSFDQFDKVIFSFQLQESQYQIPDSEML